MNAPWGISPAWWHALTLAERIAIVDGAGTAYTQDGLDIQAAESRLQRWRSQPPFSDGALFAQRLEQVNINQQALLTILATPVKSLQQRSSTSLPPWLIELLDAYSQTTYETPQPGEGEFGFLELVQPLVDRASDRLADAVRELIETCPTLPFDPDTLDEVLLMNLPDPLLMRLGRTLALELNVARLLNQLEGDTPEDRFASFVKRLQRPEEAIGLLAEYPVLARQLVICVRQWADVSLELLERLCADWDEIRKTYSPHQDPGALVELAGGAGDTHREGRSVMVARFESGLQIVYKPKSLAVDRHFQELLEWLNRRGCQPPLRTLRMLDRGEYGWVEFIEHRSCNAHEEIERFYQRLGGYLALLYTINASDFHLENLIASGEYPMLIDLETLFNPEFERFEQSNAEAEAAKAMLRSVLVVGMLPQRLWSDAEYGGVDISGLGGEEGQMSPDRIPRPTGLGTDEMRYVRERAELIGEANRPMLYDVETSAVDYVEEVIGGFSAMCGLLLQYREELLADDGPLQRFEQDEVRVLLRPTRTYDQLLFESFHPDMLRDALERDLLMDRLWMVVSARPHMAKVIGVEQADLQQGDIPVFTTRPTSLHLWSGCGQVIDGVLLETGMAIARRRLAQLDEADMRRQQWIIRSTLASISPSARGFDRPASPVYRHRQQSGGPDRTQLLATARAIANRLVETAITGVDDVTWLGLTQLPEESWDLAPLGMDLYGGVAGVTLFLAYAGELLGDLRYCDFARRGLNGLVQHAEQFVEELPDIGGFDGWGGVLYAMTHLAVLCNEPSALSSAESVVEAIARFADRDDAFGVVYGAAGAIGSLLAYHHRTSSERALEAATACGEHLIASVQPQAQGLGWVAEGFGTQPLTGFGHGAAGIAWALLELSAVTGNLHFREVAYQAIEYERSLYLVDVENWHDLRQNLVSRKETEPKTPQTMAAWCHGAAGIGLARLQALRHGDDPQLRAEVEAALRTTKARGFGLNHSLCHGDLGNLELLLQAGQILDDARWRAESERHAAMILDSIQRKGWRCGGPEAVEMPSLMLGLAGIGYQLLRLAEPERVPSLLMLGPPS